MTKIAIHINPGSWSDRWVDCCKKDAIPFKEVDLLGDNVISETRDCDIILSNFRSRDFIAQRNFPNVLYALERQGKILFPNFQTFWGYNDKVAQKYLLEALSISHPKTHVFYSEASAMAWLSKAEYPIVFKLKDSAGGLGVKLIRSLEHAKDLCTKSFSTGFNPVSPYLTDFRTKFQNARLSGLLVQKLRNLLNALIRSRRARGEVVQRRDYIYFQEFVPDCDYDVRVVVIGLRAWAFKRVNRKEDFRASGSGVKDMDPLGIDPEVIKAAFKITAAIGAQSLALDFLIPRRGPPVCIEISYCFGTQVGGGSAITECPGCWNHRLEWLPGKITHPADEILRSILQKA